MRYGLYFTLGVFALAAYAFAAVLCVKFVERRDPWDIIRKGDDWGAYGPLPIIWPLGLVVFAVYYFVRPWMRAAASFAEWLDKVIPAKGREE